MSTSTWAAKTAFNLMRGAVFGFPTKRIVLVRHAHVEDYISKGDCKAEISKKGWRQTVAGGRALTRYFNAHGITKWPRVYISSYERPQQTFVGMRLGMSAPFRDNDPESLYEEVRLIEKNFGLTGEYATMDVDHPHKGAVQAVVDTSSAAYNKDPFLVSAPMGESNMDVLIRTKSFTGSLYTDLLEGEDTVVIVAHGAVIKAIEMNWFHLPMSVWGGDGPQLETPNNCDLTVIEGTPKSWSLTKIYDGLLKQDVQINPIAEIQRLNMGMFPKAPEWLNPENV